MLKLSSYFYKLPQPERISVFWKFLSNECWIGYTTNYELNLWLSKNEDDSVPRRLYGCGPTRGGGWGLGTNMLGSGQSGGYEPACLMDPANPWEEGETIEDFYISGYCLYYMTNLGNVYSIGTNTYGQLGLGDTTIRTRVWRKITTFDKNIAKIFPGQGGASFDFCFAVTKTGELYGWGYNDGYRNLGIPNTSSGWNVNQLTPRLLNEGSLAGKTITKAFAISPTSSSQSCSFAIDSNRDIHIAGHNNAGILGNTLVNNGYTDTTGWRELNEGYKADKIYADNYGGNGTAFLFDQQLGKVYASGYNGYGQLGDGTTTARVQFMEVGYLAGLDIVDFYAGNHYVANPVAILSDGTIRTWGYNAHGQVGDGTTTARTASIWNPNDNSSINLGPSNRCIKVRYGGISATSGCLLTDQGQLWSVGHNNHGQLGLGDATNRSVWTRVQHPTGRKFVNFEWSGDSSNLVLNAVDEDGEMWCAGYAGRYSNAAPDRSGQHYYFLRKAHIKGDR